MASTTFDLPLPLGPTTTVIPGSKSSVARSAKDLKPRMTSDFRNTRRRGYSGSERARCARPAGTGRRAPDAAGGHDGGDAPRRDEAMSASEDASSGSDTGSDSGSEHRGSERRAGRHAHRPGVPDLRGGRHRADPGPPRPAGVPRPRHAPGSATGSILRCPSWAAARPRGRPQCSATSASTPSTAPTCSGRRTPAGHRRAPRPRGPVEEDLREIETFRDLPRDASPLEVIGELRLQGARERFVRHRTWDVYPYTERNDELPPPDAERHRGVIAASHPGQRVVVACHGGVINAYVGEVLGLGHGHVLPPGPRLGPPGPGPRDDPGAVVAERDPPPRGRRHEPAQLLTVSGAPAGRAPAAPRPRRRAGSSVSAARCPPPTAARRPGPRAAPGRPGGGLLGLLLGATRPSPRACRRC